MFVRSFTAMLTAGTGWGLPAMPIELRRTMHHARTRGIDGEVHAGELSSVSASYCMLSAFAALKQASECIANVNSF
jgi:hypothetical protein